MICEHNSNRLRHMSVDGWFCNVCECISKCILLHDVFSFSSKFLVRMLWTKSRVIKMLRLCRRPYFFVSDQKGFQPAAWGRAKFGVVLHCSKSGWPRPCNEIHYLFGTWPPWVPRRVLFDLFLLKDFTYAATLCKIIQCGHFLGLQV